MTRSSLKSLSNSPQYWHLLATNRHILAESPAVKILLLLLSSAFCLGEDLPKPAQAAIEKTQVAIDKIQADVNAKCNKEREALMSTLGKMQDAATKASDLGGALAPKKKIDEIRVDIKDTQPKPKEVVQWWVKITTVEQWNAIEGQDIVVQATSADFDTGVKVPPGKSVVVVSRPGDTWATGAAWPAVGVGGDMTAPPNRGAPLMAMLLINGNTSQVIAKDPVVVGPMRIHLKSNDGIYNDNSGEIHVKIVPVDRL